MTTLFNIWTKDTEGKFTRLYTGLACCDAEMAAVCLGISQADFTAFATTDGQELLGPQLQHKDVAIHKSVFPFHIPSTPLESQISFQNVPPIYS